MRIIHLAIGLVAIQIVACSKDSSEQANLSSYNYVQPSASICDVSAGFDDGFLCAIKPSKLDAGARDIFGVSTPEDLAYGFGYHAIAFPNTGTMVRGVYVHLGGSLSRPYDQDTTGLASKSFLLESLTSGYIMIQLAYNNRYAVNSVSECGGANVSIDNCAGNVRKEKITGQDVSTVNDTPLVDSIEQRLKVLVRYLSLQGFDLPVTVVRNDSVDWSVVRIGGHSQGAGHALYIKKYLNGGQVCMIAGAYDVADSVPSVPSENMADWLLDAGSSVDVSSLRALVSVDDSSYSFFIGTYAQLGLVENTHWFSIDGAPYIDSDGGSIDGHVAPLLDPRYVLNRNSACFTD